MTTMAGSILLKSKTWALVPVFFLLSSVIADGFADVSKPNTGEKTPAVSQGPAQGGPSRNSPADPDKKAGPEKPKEPAPPFEDFVPSEKIEADKAVDFPVDI
jgi:hypothetical protein